ncbi:MAG: hypothetical protein ACOVKV_02215, partial [Novosphingobium sp.]
MAFAGHSDEQAPAKNAAWRSFNKVTVLDHLSKTEAGDREPAEEIILMELHAARTISGSTCNDHQRKKMFGPRMSLQGRWRLGPLFEGIPAFCRANAIQI